MDPPPVLEQKSRKMYTLPKPENGRRAANER